METMIKTEAELYSDETRAAYREAYQKLIDEHPGAYPWFAVETNEVNSQCEEPDMAELWCTMRVMDARTPLPHLDDDLRGVQ